MGGFEHFPQFSPGFLGSGYIDPGNPIQVLVDGMSSFSHDDSVVFLSGPPPVHTWDPEGPWYDVALAQFTIESSGDEWMEMGGVIQWWGVDGEPVQTDFHAVIPARSHCWPSLC